MQHGVLEPGHSSAHGYRPQVCILSASAVTFIMVLLMEASARCRRDSCTRAAACLPWPAGPGWTSAKLSALTSKHANCGRSGA